MALFTPPQLPQQRRPGPPPSVQATSNAAGSIAITSTVQAFAPFGAGSIAATGSVAAVGASLASGTGSIAATASLAATASTGSIFPLTISSDGRYFKQNDGTPILIAAQTTWSLFVDIPLSGLNSFLTTIKGQGFNALMGNAIEHHYTVVKPPKERSGLLPFTQRLDGATYTGSPNGTSGAAGTQGQFASDNYGSPSSQSPDCTFINNSYWLVVEQILDACLQANIAVFVWPGYLGFHAGDEGWMLEMTQWDAVTGAGGFTGQSFANATKSKLWNYGAWLAARWKNYPNIIWTMGGDYGTNTQTLSTAERAAVVSLVAGMKSVSGQQSTLWTAHWDRPCISDDNLISGVTWDLNFCYCDEAVAEVCRRGYSTAAKPSILGEYNYEDGLFGGSAPWRKYLYWGFLGGVAGGFYGHEQLWRFDDGSPGTDYTTLLATQGTLDAQRQFAFWRTRPWHRLKPNGLGGIGTLITAGGGTASPQSTTYVSAAATSEGDLLLAYIPPDHTGSVTIDMTKMSATAQARWFDPTNSAFTVIGAFNNSSTHAFTPPGSNNAGDTDFLLVLETPAATVAATSTATGTGAALASTTGTVSGTVGVAGAGASTAATAATATGTCTVTASANSVLTGDGSVAIVAAVAAVGSALVAGTATAAGAAALTSVGQSAAASAGGAAGVAAVAAVGQSIASSVGSVATTLAVAGVSSALAVTSGTAVIAGGVSGAGAMLAAAVGSIAGTAGTTATGQATAAGAGTAAGIAAVSGVGSALAAGSASAAGTLTVEAVGGGLTQGSGTGVIAASGAVAAVGAALGAGAGVVAGAGTLAAVAAANTGAGDVAVSAALAAVGAAISTGAGAVSAVATVSAVGSGSGTSVGTAAATSTFGAVGAALASGAGSMAWTATVDALAASSGAAAIVATVVAVGAAVVQSAGTAAGVLTVSAAGAALSSAPTRPRGGPATKIAKLVATNFAKFGKDLGIVQCTLTKSVAGTRTPGAVSAGTNPVFFSYKAMGLVSDYKAYYSVGQTQYNTEGLVKQADRQVVLFGASIQDGVVPEAGDRIAIGGETLTIIKDGVDSDPVKATHTCTCRR